MCSGGLGAFAVQLCATSGANAIGVVSDDDKRDFVMQLGAKGVLTQGLQVLGPAAQGGLRRIQRLAQGNAPLWSGHLGNTGKGVNVDCVFEHPGETTIPVSVQVVKRGGMVVICAGTTGFNLTMDARYLWMHQKRLQGSHFANLQQASQANKLVIERRIDPCMSEVFSWAQIPKSHMRIDEERAQARQHGRARLGTDDGAPYVRRRARGQPGPLRQVSRTHWKQMRRGISGCRAFCLLVGG